MVLVLIAAVVITPTRDVFNMLLVAMPLYTLFEVGLLLARVLE
jgi:sec-independent protein translocase protein TatC